LPLEPPPAARFFVKHPRSSGGQGTWALARAGQVSQGLEGSLP
jgi:hypothetical protein